MNICALWALAGMAMVLEKQGKSEQAAEVAAHVFHNPITDAETKSGIEQILSGLESQMCVIHEQSGLDRVIPRREPHNV